MKRGIWICSSVITCILATMSASSAQLPGHNALAVDLDQESWAPPLPGSSLCGRPAVTQAPPGMLAMIVILGPMSSTQLSYEIWNYADESISAVTVDGFDALGGQGLLFSKAITAHAADVGSVRVEYPQSGVDGKGPIVLRFDGFGAGRCAAVDAEASTWGQATFHGRVMDAVGTRIQVVFEGGSRGSGEVVLCGSNSRFSRDVPCHPGDAVASISGSRTMQVRLSK
jgi:hypothetical protein